MGERKRLEYLLTTGRELRESRRSQKVRFLKEMAAVRTPERLDQKVADFLDIQGFPSAEVRRAYEIQKPLLSELFGTIDTGIKKNFLYHGAGFYKYDGEKYGPEENTGNTIELLPRILQEGLKTHHDPWVPDRDTQTVSLADSYFYAKWFADKNMTDEIKPEWQLGDPNDFFRFFFADTFRAELAPQKIIGHITNKKQWEQMKKERAQRYENKLRNWTTSYRSDTSAETPMNDLLNGHSNIEGNFGCVFCLDKKEIPYERLPVGGAHEVRSPRSIAPSTISAIGVPLQKVEYIQQLLLTYSRSDIDVFAIECADLHFSSFPIENLVARVE